MTLENATSATSTPPSVCPPLLVCNSQTDMLCVTLSACSFAVTPLQDKQTTDEIKSEIQLRDYKVV